jgi:hypothetical protein
MYDETIHGTVNITHRVYGQLLKGNMIPKREIEMEVSGKRKEKPGGIRGMFRTVSKAPGKLMLGLGKKKHPKEVQKDEATETAALLDHDEATYNSTV